MSSTLDISSEMEAINNRISELERENAALRADRQQDLKEARKSSSGFSWRSFGSALMIIAATLLVPLSVVGGWAKAQLVDEAEFVSTLAPLAKDEAVQEELVVHVSAAIQQELNVQELVGSTIDGLSSLNIPSEAKTALGLLKSPAIQGVNSVIDTAVAELVRSEAFSDTWRTVLAASHRALVLTASGSTSSGEVTIDRSGEVVLHLGPIIDVVKKDLVKQGFTMANQIPDVDPTMVLAQNESLTSIGVVYHVATTVGWILPLLTMALAIGGILMARNRWNGATGVGIGSIIGGGVTLIALSIAGAITVARAASYGISTQALQAVYEQLVSGMKQTSVTLIVLGVILVIFAWVMGDSRPAQAIRGAIDSGSTSVADSLNRRGMNGGPVGRWLMSQKVLAVTLLAILFVVALVFLPMSLATVLGTTVLALLLWWIGALLEKSASLEATRALNAPVAVADVVVPAPSKPATKAASKAPEKATKASAKGASVSAKSEVKPADTSAS